MGVAVGMCTGVVVGLGETISTPARALRRMLPGGMLLPACMMIVHVNAAPKTSTSPTTGQESSSIRTADAQHKLHTAADDTHYPAVANAMPGVLQPYGSIPQAQHSEVW